MGITIRETGCPCQGRQPLVQVRDESWRCLWFLLDTMESVKRDVKDVKIIAAGGS